MERGRSHLGLWRRRRRRPGVYRLRNRKPDGAHQVLQRKPRTAQALTLRRTPEWIPYDLHAYFALDLFTFEPSSSSRQTNFVGLDRL
jgi:hypothetical protein